MFSSLYLDVDFVIFKFFPLYVNKMQSQNTVRIFKKITVRWHIAALGENSINQFDKLRKSPSLILKKQIQVQNFAKLNTLIA